MAKFESPEINVVLFSEEEVITTSGYIDNENEGIIPVGHITRLPAAPTAISRSN